MNHFDTLQNSLASVRISFDKIVAAVGDKERGLEITRGLAAAVLSELSLITEIVDLDTYISGIVGRSKTVSDFQGEYHELAGL